MHFTLLTKVEAVFYACEELKYFCFMVLLGFISNSKFFGQCFLICIMVKSSGTLHKNNLISYFSAADISPNFC